MRNGSGEVPNHGCEHSAAPSAAQLPDPWVDEYGFGHAQLPLPSTGLAPRTFCSRTRAGSTSRQARVPLSGTGAGWSAQEGRASIVANGWVSREPASSAPRAAFLCRPLALARQPHASAAFTTRSTRLFSPLRIDLHQSAASSHHATISTLIRHELSTPNATAPSTAVGGASSRRDACGGRAARVVPWRTLCACAQADRGARTRLAHEPSCSAAAVGHGSSRRILWHLKADHGQVATGRQRTAVYARWVAWCATSRRT